MKPCDEYIKKTLELSKNMLDLADDGDAVREDTECGVLFGFIRDAAFKIREMAESERLTHIKKGWWQD